MLDTSVLLADPRAITRFKEHEVVLPVVVVTELEAKRHHPELGYFARTALRMLDDLRAVAYDPETFSSVEPALRGVLGDPAFFPALLAYRAAASAIEGRFPKLAEVTQAKLFGATVGPQITLKAMELHGGYGPTTDFAIQRIHRDCVTNVVAGGAPASMTLPAVRGFAFARYARPTPSTASSASSACSPPESR